MSAEKMTSKFKLTGLSKKKSITCEGVHGDIFWPKVALTQDRFDALWDYFTGLEVKQMIAEVEHYGFFMDGTPRDATVVNVENI